MYLNMVPMIDSNDVLRKYVPIVPEATKLCTVDVVVLCTTQGKARNSERSIVRLGLPFG